jgi:hypothetical protein
MPWENRLTQRLPILIRLKIVAFAMVLAPALPMACLITLAGWITVTNVMPMAPPEL